MITCPVLEEEDWNRVWVSDAFINKSEIRQCCPLDCSLESKCLSLVKTETIYLLLRQTQYFYNRSHFGIYCSLDAERIFCKNQPCFVFQTEEIYSNVLRNSSFFCCLVLTELHPHTYFKHLYCEDLSVLTSPDELYEDNKPLWVKISAILGVVSVPLFFIHRTVDSKPLWDHHKMGDFRSSCQSHVDKIGSKKVQLSSKDL